MPLDGGFKKRVLSGFVAGTAFVRFSLEINAIIMTPSEVDATVLEEE
jgi:hypothetical protein